MDVAQSATNPKYADIDPMNRLLWRANVRRLDFESMRDSFLYVGGKLDLRVGGAPVNLFAEPYSTRRSLYGYLDREATIPHRFTRSIFIRESPRQSVHVRIAKSWPQVITSPAGYGKSRVGFSVGFPQSPCSTGNGGRSRGMPRLPSTEAINAVSSPHTNAPAPSLMLTRNG